MKKMTVFLGLLFISFVAAACNNADETESSKEENAGEEETNDDESAALDEEIAESDDVENGSDHEASEDDAEANEDNPEVGEENYTEEQVSGNYQINGEWLEGTDFVYYFTRENNDLTREDRIHQALIESDPSQRDLFSATTDFEVDGSVVNLYYHEDETASMASTESAQFWEALNEIGFRYGLDEYNLFDQDGERGLTFAEGYWDDPVEIEQEPNRGYYVVSPEVSERGEYTYMSGAVAEEEIHADDGELFDFEQTVEAMATVQNEEGSYYSGIYEGVEIEEAAMDDNQAIVRYQIDDTADPSQQEREDFEQVLQLAALDFQAEELKLVNETEQVISVYPLLEADGGNSNADTSEDDASESESDEGTGNTDEQVGNTDVTEDEAISLVFDYVDEHEDVNREDVKAMAQDNGENEGYYKVQAFVYAGGEEDEAQMTNTIGWYLVDKETGEVEEEEL